MIVPEGAERSENGQSLAVPDRPDVDRDRFFGRLLVAGASATVVLQIAALATAPASQRSEVLVGVGIIGGLVALAVWFLRRGFSNRLLLIGCLVLMALGVFFAATEADGLDAAVILPLTGALIVSRVLRGRRLLVMFVAAFVASLAGEVVFHVEAWSAARSFSVNQLIAVTSSAVMLAIACALAWWVNNEWLLSTGRAAHALVGQRQLLALNERLVATLDPQQVLSVIADSLKPVVGYDNLTIYRVDREAGLLRPVLARDRFASLILESTFALDHGITGWVVTHGEAQCINDAQRDPRMVLIPGTPAEDESLIVVPLAGDGKVVGTLNLGRMGTHFDSTDFEMAQLFARQASVAMQNAEAHRAVSSRAETDALTGLGNRGAFEEDIAALLVDQGAQPVTLLMLDLDGFKAFNDLNGHPAGDVLLAAVARAITSAVRAGDRVCRYGGDEFAVLLPGTVRVVGAHVAERIRAGVAALESGRGVSVTASLGVACNADGAVTRDDLVAAADAALYRAKASGRNQVAVAGRLPVPSTTRETEPV